MSLRQICVKVHRDPGEFVRSPAEVSMAGRVLSGTAFDEKFSSLPPLPSGAFCSDATPKTQPEPMGHPAPQSEASLRASGQWAKAAISLGVQMAESEARRMLALKVQAALPNADTDEIAITVDRLLQTPARPKSDLETPPSEPVWSTEPTQKSPAQRWREMEETLDRFDRAGRC